MTHKQKSFRLDGHRHEIDPRLPQSLIQVYVRPLSANAPLDLIHACVDKAASASAGTPWTQEPKLMAQAYAYAVATHRKNHGLKVGCQSEGEENAYE